MLNEQMSMPWRFTPCARPLEPRHAVLVSLAIVVLWALWAAHFNTAQFGDNIEQFNWAQSLELGYHKHPPLPSWALAATVRLFGPSIYWAYVLATLCLLGTATFTWLVGRRLIGDRVAAAAIVLWGLNLCFSQRVQLYNHNTVLVLWIAATAWFAMRSALATRGQPLWWIATGLTAAAAILSKYQAVVPLAGVVLALGWAGQLHRPAQRRGLLLAAAVLVLACAPHAVWVVHHDFSTLRYASDAVESSGLFERAGFVVSFFANQVRFSFPALLAIGLCRWWSWWHDHASPRSPTDAAIAPESRAWMFGLI
jgi:4-amino-4-deoxy-L-arabinose transferase-like glycosyltransferase